MDPPSGRSWDHTRSASSSTRGSGATEPRRSAGDPAELVRKVLVLERSQGFRDQAAFGGLESFVRQWLPTGPVVSALAGYDGLTPPERAGRIEAALRSLTGPPVDGVAVRPSGLPPAPRSPGSAVRPPAGPVASGRPPAPEARVDPPPARLAPPVPGPATPPVSPPPATASAPSNGGAKAVPGRKAGATKAGAAARRRAEEPAGAGATGARPVGTGLQTPVSRLKGVGPSLSRRLDKLGLETVRDLLFHFPSRHVDYSRLKKVQELAAGDVATVVVSVWDVGSFPTRRGLERIEAVTGDETGNLLAVWFRRRNYFGSKLRGQQVVLSGRIESRNGRLFMNDPELEFLEQADLVSTARLVPFYPLTEGLNQRWLRNLIKGAVDRYAALLPDPLPAGLRESRGFVPLAEAIAQMHFPDDEAGLERARRRLGFEELFMIQLGVAQRKRSWQADTTAPPLVLAPELEAALRQALPFRLTGAQERVVGQILADVGRRMPMARLLQGDVGAGKTIVAALAMLAAAGSGSQALLMAPTELLAEQHHRTIARLLGAEEVRAAFARVRGRPGPEVALLIGSTPRAQRRRIEADAASGALDVVVGTHTLIQETLTLASLGLGVVDEQHRFGVLQRSALRQKGYNPHLLVMTATPIPRTLAMTVYGELDVSVIDELPPGRQAIKTRWLGPPQRRGAYEFLRREVGAGRQAFVVCPLVEESEKVVTKAATAEFERLRSEVFPDLRLGLLHGRMSNAEKDAVMAEFRRGDVQVLVATTVIEVGIDVPNATVMLIEGADRFGLAQLHQLRGRVGRGAEQSYCMLLSEAPSLDGQERLRVIEETNDGFALAEEDLRIRGPGEFLGTRQSGLPELRVASLGDLQAIEEARRAAFELIEADPGLTRPEHAALAERVAELASVATDLS